MKTLEHNRLRSRRYVRARARGLSREAACRVAGYFETNATRIERRLKGEVAKQRKKLAGQYGHIPARFGAKDARRIARQELERVADHWGPNHEQVIEQTLRSLAQQVSKSIAFELLQSYGKRHLKAQRDGGDAVRSAKLVHYAGRLYTEIAKGSANGSATAAEAAAARQALEKQAAPQEPMCPKHPTQRAGLCVWCGQANKKGEVYTETALPDWVRRQGGRY